MTSPSSFTMGQAPSRMTLALSRGADFVAALTRADGQSWPTTAGSSVYIEVGDVQWPAAVVGATLAWNVPKAEVAAVIATVPKRARLYYVEAGVRLLWASGPVVIT